MRAAMAAAAGTPAPRSAGLGSPHGRGGLWGNPPSRSLTPPPGPAASSGSAPPPSLARAEEPGRGRGPPLPRLKPQRTFERIVDSWLRAFSPSTHPPKKGGGLRRARDPSRVLHGLLGAGTQKPLAGILQSLCQSEPSNWAQFGSSFTEQSHPTSWPREDVRFPSYFSSHYSMWATAKQVFFLHGMTAGLTGRNWFGGVSSCRAGVASGQPKLNGLQLRYFLKSGQRSLDTSVTINP